jgi:hypothetical protein
MSLNSVSPAVFSTNFVSNPKFSARVVAAIARFLACIPERVVISTIPILNRLPIPSALRLNAACNELREVVSLMVDERLQQLRDRPEMAESFKGMCCCVVVLCVSCCSFDSGFQQILSLSLLYFSSLIRLLINILRFAATDD